MTALQFVLDPVRDTFRCRHCRAEIHVDQPLADAMLAQSDFVGEHLQCLPGETPAPLDVRLAAGLLRRDHQGLWTSWQPLPVLRAWQIQTVTRAEAVAQLHLTHHTLQQRVTRLGQPQDAAQLRTLTEALTSEGEGLTPAPEAVAG